MSNSNKDALEGGTPPQIGEDQEVEKSMEEMFSETPPESKGDVPQDISPETSPGESKGDVIRDTQESLERLASDPRLAGEVLAEAADSAVALSRRGESSPGKTRKLNRVLGAVVASALIVWGFGGGLEVGLRLERRKIEREGKRLRSEELTRGAVRGDEKVAVEDERGEITPELKKLEQEFEEGTIGDEDLEALVIVYSTDVYTTSMDFGEEKSPENSKRFIEAIARYKKAFKEAQKRGLYSEKESQRRGVHPENSPRQA